MYLYLLGKVQLVKIKSPKQLPAAYESVSNPQAAEKQTTLTLPVTTKLPQKAVIVQPSDLISPLPGSSKHTGPIRRGKTRKIPMVPMKMSKSPKIFAITSKGSSSPSTLSTNTKKNRNRTCAVATCSGPNGISYFTFPLNPRYVFLE